MYDSDLASDVIVEDGGDIEACGGEKFSDREKVRIVRSLESVVDTDEARVIIWLNADDCTA